MQGKRQSWRRCLEIVAEGWRSRKSKLLKVALSERGPSLPEAVPLHTEGNSGSVIWSSGLKSKWDTATGEWRWGKPLPQGPIGSGAPIDEGGAQLLCESGNACCAHHGSSSRLPVLWHVEKPVQVREGLGEWRPEADGGGRRVPRKEDRAGRCGVLTDALKLYVLRVVWSLQCEVSREKESPGFFP